MDLERVLADFYTMLKRYRQEGVKMKSISEALGITPSILSAMYTTVLPTFTEAVEKGTDCNTALEEALQNVNNISRKRLLEIVEDMSEKFKNVKLEKADGQPHPYLRFLKKETERSAAFAKQFEGVYMSYSCSSSLKALKLEPYYISASEAHNCLAVGRKSVHNVVREGIGIIKEQQILYLMFNAFEEPNISLVNVYLQLPFLEELNILKGLYIVLDYNKNPIARRIVLIKKGKFSMETFQKLEAKLLMPHDFTDNDKLLYNYTCGDEDVLKMCTLPSPRLNLTDLANEKALLTKEEEYLNSITNTLRTK